MHGAVEERQARCCTERRPEDDESHADHAARVSSSLSQSASRCADVEIGRRAGSKRAVPSRAVANTPSSTAAPVMATRLPTTLAGLDPHACAVRTVAGRDAAVHAAHSHVLLEPDGLSSSGVCGVGPADRERFSSFDLPPHADRFRSGRRDAVARDQPSWRCSPRESRISVLRRHPRREADVPRNPHATRSSVREPGDFVTLSSDPADFCPNPVTFPTGKTP